jgi:hypothetical protein
MKRARFHEPSLVPLADMLTNTVGIVVFILIFTVLTAGGAVVTKRLPMERASTTKPIKFLCAKGHLLPLIDDDAFMKRFLEPVGEPRLLRNLAEFEAWKRKFNARTLVDEYFEVEGEAEGMAVNLAFTPRPGAGDGVADLGRLDSALRRTLARYSPSEHFAYFIVADDSVDVFVKAREVVSAQLHFGYGWTPTRRDQPVRLTYSGDGEVPTPQAK